MIWKDNKGISLIELLVALFLLSIIMLSATSILLSSVKQINQGKELVERPIIMETLADFMIAQIEDATMLTLSENQIGIVSSGVEVNIGVSDQGYLYVGSEEELVFPKEFYGNLTCKFYFEDKEGSEITGVFKQGDILKAYLNMQLLVNEEVKMNQVYGINPILINQ